MQGSLARMRELNPLTQYNSVKRLAVRFKGDQTLERIEQNQIDADIDILELFEQ